MRMQTLCNTLCKEPRKSEIFKPKRLVLNTKRFNANPNPDLTGDEGGRGKAPPPL